MKGIEMKKRVSKASLNFATIEDIKKILKQNKVKNTFTMSMTVDDVAIYLPQKEFKKLEEFKAVELKDHKALLAVFNKEIPVGYIYTSSLGFKDVEAWKANK